MGSPLIRNLERSGNIVSASVAGDSPTLFSALDATVVLKSVSGERTMSIDEFNEGPGKCQIRPDELLTDVRFRLPGKKQAVAYRKFGRRKALAIVVLAVAIFVEVDDNNIIRDARVILGAVGLHPLSSKKLADLLIGRKADRAELLETLPAFTEEVDAAIGNRPSVVYKREGVRGLATYCFEDIVRELTEKGARA